MQLSTISQSATMSSREIAELVGATHDSVLKTVRRLIAEGVVFFFFFLYKHPQNGQTYPEFVLDFRNTMVVASGYSAELRARIIDRWPIECGANGSSAACRVVKVLIACESSGTVRDAFIRAGHDAMSCDMLPTDKTGPHYQGDVRDVLGDGWDLLIGHPPCTYLSVSGMHWTTRGLRWGSWLHHGLAKANAGD